MRTLTVLVWGTSPRPVTITRSHTRPTDTPDETENALRPVRETRQEESGTKVMPSREAVSFPVRTTLLVVPGTATVSGNVP